MVQNVVTSWWASSLEDVFAGLTTAAEGLSTAEAQRRLAANGHNELPEPEADPWWKALINAFKDPFALVLTAAAIVTGVSGWINNNPEDIKTAPLLIGIVVFMALMAFFTERQADKSLEKLKVMQQTHARVYRDGRVVEVDARELVVGDVILLKEGDKVPADARVVSSERGEFNEALLTGESKTTMKLAEAVTAEADLAERTSMVYSGSYVASGSLTAVVVGTGLATELGKIWESIRSTEEGQTPLQQQLDRLGKVLMWATLVVCVAVCGVYVFRGDSILHALTIAVALAIAFIPEALGAVITIALALGVREMVGKKAIIKNLKAAEGLGSVSVVCTDKTGTVTEGVMTATDVWTVGFAGRLDGKLPENRPDIDRLVRIAHLCNDLGNQTERALADLAKMAGLEITADSRSTRVHEIAFTSARKIMTTVNPDGESLRALTKGAPDVLVDYCTHVLDGEMLVPINTELRNRIREAVQGYEEKGYRVLAFADRELDHKFDQRRVEEQMTFVGLVALSDPARPTVRDTVAVLLQAGITPVMITGDSPLTALAIAKDVGIVPANATQRDVLLGRDVDAMTVNGVDNTSAADLRRIVECRVFARTSPSNKIAIVAAMQRAGKLVAMTGDGVNDAPSLKKADVGIAMAAGTEITKETADVVLTGDYSAIAAAVEVGRTILHRTRLYSHALLSTNGAEVLIFVVAVVKSWVAPFTAVQLLLINVLGDAWLSIALATEKPEADVMQQPPRRKEDPIISPYMYGSIALQSVVTTAILAAAWILTGNYAETLNLSAGATVMLQQSVLFCVFMTQKILRSSFTARSLKYNIWQIGFFSNVWCLLAALVTVGLTVIGLWFPYFGMHMLPQALLPLLALGLIPPVVEELVKLVRRAFGPKHVVSVTSNTGAGSLTAAAQ